MLLVLLRGMWLVVASGEVCELVALVVAAPREKRSLRTIFCDGLVEGAVGSRRTRGACAAIESWARAASLLLQGASIRAGKTSGGGSFLTKDKDCAKLSLEHFR